MTHEETAARRWAPADRLRGLPVTSWLTIGFLVASVVLGVLAIQRHSELLAWESDTLAWLPFFAAVLGLVHLPPQRALRVAAIVAVAAAGLIPVFASAPQFVGDAGEYYQMSIGFLSHGSPDLRPEDSATLIAASDAQGMQGVKAGVGAEDLGNGYFEARDGARYSYHFWLHSLAAAPLMWLLGVLGLGSLKAFQVMNATLLLAALFGVLFFADLRLRQRQVFAVLWALSPVVWYVGAVGAEVWSASWSVIGIVLYTRRHPALAVAAVSLAAAQNPPLVLLALLLGSMAMLDAVRGRRLRRVVALTAALLPAALPYAFYLVRFGTPNLIVEVGAASIEMITLRKVGEVFFDLNQGLIAYEPLLLVLVIVAVVFAVRERDLLSVSLAAAVVGMAALSATAGNWNSGSVGLMRYAVWLIPVVIWLLVRTLGYPRDLTWWRPAVYAAVAVELVVLVAASVSPSFAPSNVRPGYLARFVIERAPALYTPTPEIFAERSLGADGEWRSLLPIGHITEDRRVLEILMEPSQAPLVAEGLGVDVAEVESHMRPADEGLVYVAVPSELHRH